MFFFYLLTLINSAGIAYLIFLFYKKGKITSKDGQNVTINPKDFSVKLGLTRFNPFGDMGGDQSFILSILDHTNTGVIITSLHNRDLTRIYAKSIKNGEGDNFTLSKEEKSAIVKTIKG